MTEQTTEAPEAQEAPQVGLSLQDIANALQIIDIAVSRGSIRGEETSSVGMVRDRLAAFLAANQQQQAAEVESDAPNEAEEASE